MRTKVKRHGSKVVTFRVPEEVYEQLEQVKEVTGLSFTDLVKLGAQIADEQVKDKLAEINGLEARLTELQTYVEEEQERLEESLDEERERKFQELDTQIDALKLFDRGWGMEEVGFKLGLPEATLLQYIHEWGQQRKDRPVVKSELLKVCLKRHIDKLKNSLSWVRILPSTPGGREEELERQITDCQRLLASPSKITKQAREFLLAEYSSAVLSVVKKRPAKYSSSLSPKIRLLDHDNTD